MKRKRDYCPTGSSKRFRYFLPDEKKNDYLSDIVIEQLRFIEGHNEQLWKDLVFHVRRIIENNFSCRQPSPGCCTYDIDTRERNYDAVRYNYGDKLECLLIDRVYTSEKTEVYCHKIGAYCYENGYINKCYFENGKVKGKKFDRERYGWNEFLATGKEYSFGAVTTLNCDVYGREDDYEEHSSVKIKINSDRSVVSDGPLPALGAYSTMKRCKQLHLDHTTYFNEVAGTHSLYLHKSIFPYILRLDECGFVLCDGLWDIEICCR